MPRLANALKPWGWTIPQLNCRWIRLVFISCLDPFVCSHLSSHQTIAISATDTGSLHFRDLKYRLWCCKRKFSWLSCCKITPRSCPRDEHSYDAYKALYTNRSRGGLTALIKPTSLASRLSWIWNAAKVVVACLHLRSGAIALAMRGCCGIWKNKNP